MSENALRCADGKIDQHHTHDIVHCRLDYSTRALIFYVLMTNEGGTSEHGVDGGVH